MRLPEAKIKEGILHPEIMVREEALRYYADCFSRDTEVMPLAIQAMEKFGRENAFRYVHPLEQLAQSESTIDWVIREVHREVKGAEAYDSYHFTLSRLLCAADLKLVAPRAQEIVSAPGFTKEMVPGFQERPQLAAWDAGQCWKELEHISAQALCGKDASEVDFDHANRVVEALARQGQTEVDRLLELLAQKVEDFENDPMSWMEIFLVTFAGEMRLERAIPLVVSKLHECGEILSEECVTALAKIGTDAAVEAITEGWLASLWDYR